MSTRSVVRSFVLASVVSISLSALTAQAECVYPKVPTSYPDGRTATKEDMLAGQASVKKFMAEADTYIACIDAENPLPPNVDKMSDADKKAAIAREEIRIKKHNAVVGDEEKVRDAFNEQLHAWKEAQKAK